MSTGTLQIGPNMTLEPGGMLTVFDVKGAVQGKNWVMNVLMGMFVEVSPAPASSDIENCIGDDFVAGNSEKIHHIQVNPNTAVRLFLEGKLSRDDIKNADVSFDSRIVFRSVSFRIPDGGAHVFDVYVDPGFPQAFATIDACGNIVV